MRSLISSFAAAAFATVVLTAPALADNSGALPMGKPAGVQRAQLEAGSFIWIGLAVAIAAAASLAASSGLDHPASPVTPPVTTTTTTTTTSP
ncbi:MAG: hypothetical protein JWP16_106 [Alphaproteobacteria bacterium]|nr:hypothetical protein [Alphaproteobacteria bacterium]MDB5739066.1 hypothetical protein [Alphaproteobacteria bacterium]